ncbi:MAG: SiaC family regulatory phosphoprotein [Bacteroidota bacterium]
MKELKIESVKDKPFQPAVDFSPTTGEMEISGESYMDNADMFYEPLLNWIKEYVPHASNHVNLSIRLHYFNTSTSKYL